MVFQEGMNGFPSLGDLTGNVVQIIILRTVPMEGIDADQFNPAADSSRITPEVMILRVPGSMVSA
jgi:hypothetical protein